MKKIISLSLILIMLLSFASCGLSKETVIGVWTGSYEYNGNSFELTISVYESGSFSKESIKNSSETKTVKGNWKIEGNDLLLTHYDDPIAVSSTSRYNYNNGSLVGELGGGSSYQLKKIE